MITQAEKIEIISKGKMDGARLYKVANDIYRHLIVMNWFFGIIGCITSIISIIIGVHIGSDNGAFMSICGIIGIFSTLAVCAFNYAIAVMSTHIAKVLVHILFSNVALMQLNGES